MPRNKELVIDVAHRIRDILDDYPAGPTILREILQNTDDAGGRVQRFILDTRQHSSEGLFDPVLEGCQGPAIIACNDSSFQPRDWEAICKISDSSKKGDEKSTGKFGLGFCTCYHVTDYPHVLSGDQLLILDPHKSIEHSSGCVEFSTLRSPGENDRDKYTAHFDAFSGLLNSQDDVFDGTAIRLPLRLPNSKSRINPTPMSIEAAKEIFNIFMKDDLPEVMLFLKHITTIEVSEILPDGTKTLHAVARIENADEIVAERSKTRGRSPSSETSHYRLALTKTFYYGSKSESKTKDWVITHYVDSFRIASSIMAKELKRINDQDKVEEEMNSDKLFPHVALAFPLPDPGPSSTPSISSQNDLGGAGEAMNSEKLVPTAARTDASSKPTFHGRLFTLLPLPIFTHFPLHIHATLALTSSRQNLRNAQENVTDCKSRLRVQWNQLIFSRFVPEAWVSLMKYLVSAPQGIDVFDTWPSSEAIGDDGHGYWPSFPQVLLKEAAVREVWPLRSKLSPPKKLADVLVAPNYKDAELLSALEACNVPVVVVPPNIFNFIDGSDPEEFREIRERILTQSTAVSSLRGNNKLLSQLEPTAVKALCDYIVMANDISLIHKLPIIPNVAGGHTSILPNLPYILAKDSEAEVFQTVAQDLLAADKMSSYTHKLLLDKSDGKIHYLEPNHVVQYLKKRVGVFAGARIATVFNGVSPLVSKWLVAFWAWMDKWEKLDALVADTASWNAIQDLYALPLRTANNRYALRSVKNSAIRPAQTQEDVLSALVSLDVPVLLGTMTNGRSIQIVSKKPNDVEFILQNLPKSNKSFQSLNQSSRKALHDFFTTHISHLIASSRNKSESVIDSACQNALRTLPIFPLLHPGERSSESLSFDVAPEGFRFVSQFVQVIPNIKGIAFFDFEQGMPLCHVLGANAIDEVAVLEMTIEPEAWRHLHPSFIPDIIARLIHRLSDFKEATRSRISELDIVDVGPLGRRKSPKSVVDPFSPLAGLFDPEDEILPVGEFAKDGQGSYLQHLRNHQMLQTILTDEMLEERIDYIIAASQGSDPGSGARKALRLLALLDERFKGKFLADTSPSLVEILCQKAWIPIGNQIYQSSDCWGSRPVDAFLCDWVLPRVPMEVASSSLRACLEWDTVPVDVIRRQILALMDACPECQVSAADDICDRIKAILKALALRLCDGTCTQEELESLADELGDAEWVPISEGRRIKAQRTWLPSDVLEKDIGSRFFPVATSLLKEEGIRELLTYMKLPERPLAADLHSGQLEISEELSLPDLDARLREDLIRAAIDVGLEICRDRDPTEVKLLPLLVPTEMGALANVQEVLYNDMGLDPQRRHDGIQFAHPLVSQASARMLGLETYRERQLIQLESGADDKDGFFIGEDITTRIKSVLLDYDIDHSISEWIANAADAGASVLKLLVDEVTFKGNQCVPTKQDFPAGPALVVYNDALFSEDDFRGIGNIGEGGKGDKFDTIGRFGLGALSLYHFTELPMIISGGSVLLLDPSRQYLPLQKSRGIRLTLDICSQHYRDQLEPLEGVFGFFAEKGFYKGTLFRLPLRTATQAESSTMSTKHFTTVDVFDVVRRFYNSASRSLFFTPLHEISAERRTPDMTLSRIWQTTASRKTVRKDEGFNAFAASEVEIHQRGSDNETTSQLWLVTRSSTSHNAFPSKFQTLIDKHRLSKTQPNFGLALNLSAKEYIPTSTLFANLPLPVPIALPVHLHATWILAPDRRNIRNDAPIQGSDRPLDSEYNRHIMLDFIPDLYLQTLELLNEEYLDAVKLAWPRRSKADGEALVAGELYRKVSTTRRLVLRTADNVRVAPKDAVIHFHSSPPAVRKMMTKLRPRTYVPEPHFDTKFLKDWDEIQYDTPQKFSIVLRESVQEAQDLCSGDKPQITLKEVESILHCFLEKRTSLLGIPLLPLGSGKFTTFERRHSGRIIFGSRLPVAMKFFGSSRILNPKISLQTSKMLCESTGLNVEEYDTTQIKRALEEPPNPMSSENQKKVTKNEWQWHKDFIDDIISPQGKGRLEVLSKLPLIPTENGDSTVSLEYALGKSVWRQFEWESSCLSTVFLQLKIPVVNAQYIPRHLLPVSKASAPQQLCNVIEILGQFRTLIPEILTLVKHKDWATFAATVKSWVRQDSLDQVFAKPNLAEVLIHLPIFDGWRGSTLIAHVAASQLVMLPVSKNLAPISQFFPQSKVLAPRTAELEAILDKTGWERILSFDKFFALLELPQSKVSESHYTPLRTIIKLVARNHRGWYGFPLIPNGDGVLRKPGELFDHRVEAYALHYQGRPDLFIHPDFRDMADDIRNLGLRHVLNPENLLEFIEIVDKGAREDKDVMTRAEWIWNYVNKSPRAMGGIEYDQIRGLRFIPRHQQQHCPDPELRRCVPTFPMIVSPDELYLEKYAPLSWTQRAAFASPPTQSLVRLCPELGQPTVEHVVRHLIMLATTVAVGNLNSDTLFDEVQEVYNWLKENQRNVQEMLQSASSNPIWLNINLKDDPWVWRSASQLVFDLPHDTERSYRAKEFLSQYSNLVIAAGATKVRFGTISAEQIGIPHQERILNGWRTLRNGSLLFDTYFKPEGIVIGAHLGMLAAVLPYFAQALRSSSPRTEVLEYPLPDETSIFAVNGVIDFVYDGSFTPPTASTREEAGVALGNLLNLLQLADTWEIPDIKLQVVRCIYDLKLINQENCNDVLETAVACNAEALAHYCRELKELNKWQ